MENLEGKTAVVTGAASGIGRALAGRFARAGMNIVLADVEEQRLDEAVDEIGAMGVGAMGVLTDVSNNAAVEALRDKSISEFGTVHVVCNNAGVGDRSETLEEWQWVIGVNFWGVVHGMRAFLPLLVEQNEGHMVNTASMSGLMPAYGAYGASKFAVVGITEGAYHQLGGQGSDVGVSCLCPGFVDTNIGSADRNRPDWAAGLPDQTPAAEVRLSAIVAGTTGGLPAVQVADLVHDAVIHKRLWVFPHPEAVEATRPRFEAMLSGQNPPLRPTLDANGLDVHGSAT
jgi:NAD(P)-dependent dehydrogenase (short-subunit alcohol dehydrogenase family)